MDAILEAPTLDDMDAAVQAAFRAAVAEAQAGEWPEPEARHVRGLCPACGSLLVSNCYYVQARGYLIVHECWTGLGEAARDVPPADRACTYRKIL